MHPRTALFIQGVLEAVIPLYGYFEWNWDLSFILLFYLIDWILSLVLYVLKGRKRFLFSQLENERKGFIRIMIISCALATAAASLFALATIYIKPGVNWTERIIDFVLYKDMGIEQGFILVPLLVLNGILLYRQQYITPRLFERMTMPEIVKPLLQQNFLLLALGGLLCGISGMVRLPEIVAVSAIIAAITIYRTFFIRSVLNSNAR